MVRITRVKIPRSNKETHRLGPVENLFRKYWTQIDGIGVRLHPVVDPFARNCSWAGKFTNDISIDSEANYHMDAFDFLQKMHNEHRKFHIGILDPPFSARQANESYGGEGANLYASDSPRLRKIEASICRLIVPGGHIIKFGYNSNPPANNMELKEIKILSFGGVVNDWICSVWVNPNHTLGQFA